MIGLSKFVGWIGEWIAVVVWLWVFWLVMRGWGRRTGRSYSRKFGGMVGSTFVSTPYRNAYTYKDAGYHGGNAGLARAGGGLGLNPGGQVPGYDVQINRLVINDKKLWLQSAWMFAPMMSFIGNILVGFMVASVLSIGIMHGAGELSKAVRGDRIEVCKADVYGRFSC